MLCFNNFKRQNKWNLPSKYPISDRLLFLQLVLEKVLRSHCKNSWLCVSPALKMLSNMVCIFRKMFFKYWKGTVKYNWCINIQATFYRCCWLKADMFISIYIILYRTNNHYFHYGLICWLLYQLTDWSFGLWNFREEMLSQLPRALSDIFIILWFVYIIILTIFITCHIWEAGII